MPNGSGGDAASVTGAPPWIGTFNTALVPPELTQYTLVASTVRRCALLWPEASTTGWQVAAWHAPPWQSCPQPPQWTAWLLVSTHCPPHRVSCGVQPPPL